jgi:hypothetical protein
MNRISQFQSIFLKLGFILFIYIHQSLTFAYSILDLDQLPQRNKVELVSKPKPDFKGNTLDYFSYKQYLSHLFSSNAEILAHHFYCIEFVNLYNQEIKVKLFHSRKLFDNEISPILNKNISSKFYHLFKTETLIYSA